MTHITLSFQWAKQVLQSYLTSGSQRTAIVQSLEEAKGIQILWSMVLNEFHN